jgi:hypothetical protein
LGVVGVGTFHIKKYNFLKILSIIQYYQVFQQENLVYKKKLKFIFCISDGSRIREEKKQKFKNLLPKSAYTPTPLQ